MTQLEPQSVRAQRDVRAAVDEKLGQGSGMTPLEAWNKLSNVERVEWVLGEFWFGVNGANFHLWIQGQAERDFDGPRYLAAIGRVTEALDAEIGTLVRWTAERGRAVRAKERGESLMSIAPLVWKPALDRAGKVLTEVVERWPESLDLAGLDAGEPPARNAPAPAPAPREITPSEAGCRYPGCAVAFTDAATDRCEVRAAGPSVALESALFALWRHGVTDAELEALNEAAGDPNTPLAETLGAWVDFDGTGAPPSAEALNAFARAQDPVASILGIDSSATPTLHRVKSHRLDEMAAALAPYGAVRVQPDADTNFLLRLRSALRMDPDVLIVDSADIATEEEASLVVQSIWTGHLVVMGGSAEGAQWVLKELEENRPG